MDPFAILEAYPLDWGQGNPNRLMGGKGGQKRPRSSSGFPPAPPPGWVPRFPTGHHIPLPANSRRMLGQLRRAMAGPATQTRTRQSNGYQSSSQGGWYRNGRPQFGAIRYKKRKRKSFRKRK